MNYANKINKLIEDINDSGGHDISDLARALGCARCEWRPKTGYVSIQCKQPLEINEPKIVETLVHLARWCLSNQNPSPVSSLEILEGFVRHDRWQKCVINGPDAAALGYILLVVVAHINTLKSASPKAWWCVAEPVVRNLLNAWLSPVSPYTEAPTQEALAAALFGEVWLGMAKAVTDEDEVASLIVTLRQHIRAELLQGPPEVVDLPMLPMLAELVNH